MTQLEALLLQVKEMRAELVNLKATVGLALGAAQQQGQAMLEMAQAGSALEERVKALEGTKLYVPGRA
jgi:hypothetical protein